MSFLFGLLLLPVTAPARGFQFVLERLRDEANAVMLDEGRAYAELIDLSRRRSAGELSDAEYAQLEMELLERLSTIRQYRDELQYGAADVEEEESLVADGNELEDDEAFAEDEGWQDGDDGSDEEYDAEDGEEEEESYDEDEEEHDVLATEPDFEEEGW